MGCLMAGLMRGLMRGLMVEPAARPQESARGRQARGMEGRRWKAAGSAWAKVGGVGDWNGADEMRQPNPGTYSQRKQF